MRTIYCIAIVCLLYSVCLAEDDCLRPLASDDSYHELSDECIVKLKDLIIKGKDNEQKIYALNALKKSRVKSNIDFFKEILYSVNSITVQQRTIEILSDMRDKKVLPVIIEFLSSPFFAVRESVILALKKNGDDRMYPYIIRLAKSDEVIYRIYALEALYHLYDNRFYEIIVKLLQDENKSVRYFALECVVHNEVGAALPFVRTIASGDQNEEVRVKAINVLTQLRDNGAYYIFVRALTDKSDLVRDAAVEALSTFLSKESTIYLSRQLLYEREVYIKRKIIKALISAKNAGDIRGLQHIIQNEENTSLRIYCAYALGSIHDERTIPLLIGALEDSDIRVRAEAASALSNFKGKHVVVALLEYYSKENDQYVKSAIIFALKKICDAGSLQKLFMFYCQEQDAVLKMILQKTIEYIITKNIKQY
ncbi:MAG: HEAT repeat domain-containing protein [Spirochaetes bacterium]|nr:HEAT repeat domain-containing protein [Spirochaetota bacterium]